MADFILRGVNPEARDKARARALRDKCSLSGVLRQALIDYADGRYVPKARKEEPPWISSPSGKDSAT